MLFSEHTAIPLSQDVCTFCSLWNIMILYLCDLLSHFQSLLNTHFSVRPSLASLFIFWQLPTSPFLFFFVYLFIFVKNLPSNIYFAYFVCCLLLFLPLESTSMIKITLSIFNIYILNLILSSFSHNPYELYLIYIVWLVEGNILNHLPLIFTVLIIDTLFNPA